MLASVIIIITVTICIAFLSYECVIGNRLVFESKVFCHLVKNMQSRSS